jgi:hypothetical protein
MTARATNARTMTTKIGGKMEDREKENLQSQEETEEEPQKEEKKEDEKDQFEEDIFWDW